MSLNRVIAPTCLGFLLFSAALAAQPATPPLYRVAKAVDHIQIDGKLDEFSWAIAQHVGPFTLIHDPGRKPEYPTEAAIVWDNENLYVSFACRDPEPWGRMRRRDDHLWEEEVVEVFLDPNGDGKNYAELEVSPHNVVVDLLIPRPGAGSEEAIKWDITDLRTAVGRYAAGWTAEIAIPWRSLAAAGIVTAPKPGARWRVGLYRITRPGGPGKADQIAALVADQKSASVPRKGEIEQKLRQLQSDDEYAAWSPTRPERGFHDPERFGIVEFVMVP
ncbi:MAG: carbohydrate-binding family 9-like protein [Acidobacteria bacterium]|nr:carbohydrate-binding family 9-like protein [Acidobacteriota bacterium]